MESESIGIDMPSVSFPYFSIALEHLPEAKDWKIGKEYVVVLKVKQTGINMRKGKDGKEKGDVSFDVVGIETKGEAKGRASRYHEEDKD